MLPKNTTACRKWIGRSLSAKEKGYRMRYFKQRKAKHVEGEQLPPKVLDERGTQVAEDEDGEADTGVIGGVLDLYEMRILKTGECKMAKKRHMGF